jgi:serine/threonine protein kinase
MPGDSDNLNSYDEAADIYSFAIVLWEIATRETPFKDKNVLQVAQTVLTGGRLPFPADVPAAFVQLVTDCWAHNPHARPSAEAVRGSRCVWGLA